MPEKRNKYDAEFREGAVRIVEETNKADRSSRPGSRGERGHAGELGEQGPGRA